MANLNKVHESCLLDEKTQLRILVEKICQVAMDIEYAGMGDNVILAQELDHRGIKPLHTYKWLWEHHIYGYCDGGRLVREFIKRHLPDLWPNGVKGNTHPNEAAIEKLIGVNLSRKLTKLELKIETVKNVAKNMGWRATNSRNGHYVLLAAVLDYLRIEPPQYGNYRSGTKWLRTSVSGHGTTRLKNFIKTYIPELLAGESDICLDSIKSVVSPESAAPRIQKTEVAPKIEEVKRPTNVNGWTIGQDKKGYYRAYKRINRKVESVYLGKTLEGAELKLESRTKN